MADIDSMAALAECHSTILTKAAEHAERLRTLEAKLASGNDLPYEQTGGDELKKAVDLLRKSEGIAAVLKGHSTKAGVDVSAAAMGFATKSAIVSDSATGYRAPSQYVGIESSRPQLINRLRDLIPVAPATSGSVEWLQQTNAKQLAAPQYAAESPPLRDGAPKKRSNFVMTPKTSPVITLAHHEEASRQVLNDNLLLLDFLRGELFDGVERALEQGILDGAGTSGELDGLGDASNYTALTGATTGDTEVDLIRRGIGQLQAAGFVPDAIVLNAADWAVIELSKSQQGEYVAGDPRLSQEPTLWGVRVFPSQYQDAGQFVVGSFSQSMRLWVRQEAALLVSDSHAENFTKNIVTMLAEARMCLTITRAAGIIKGTF